MSIDCNNLLKNFQSVVVSYQDVSAIYSKLYSQGQLQKLVVLLTEIYDEEHFFTLTELQKFCRENNQREDDFVAEQYELNSNIFRRNLTLITQNLVEEVGKKFLEKFRVEFSGGETPDDTTNRQQDYVEPQEQQQQQQKPTFIDLQPDKNHYKSHMPEIREENETIAATPINRAVPNFMEPDDHEPHFSTGDPTYEKPHFNSVNQAYESIATEPTPRTQQERPSEKGSSAQQQTQETNNFKTTPRASPINDDPYKHIPAAFIKTNTSGFSVNEANKYEDVSRFSTEHSASQKKKEDRSSFSPVKFESKHHWSSPDRTAALAKKIPNSAHLQKGVPLSAASHERRNLSMMANSFSNWSMSGEKPDPSILDSEFSYGQGKSFSKSPKKFHHDIQKHPGPGNYEVDETTQIKNVKHSFVKSAKVPSYFTKSQVPGAIYYPVKHYLSK